MKRPTHFTPLLLRRIRRAARMGLSAERIAAQFYREVPFILEVCRVHGITITGVARPDHTPGQTLPSERSTIGVTIANESLTVFEREAQRRGTSAPLLAGQILNIIAADGLFAAIVDG